MKTVYPSTSLSLTLQTYIGTSLMSSINEFVISTGQDDGGKQGFQYRIKINPGEHFPAYLLQVGLCSENS